MSLPVSEHVYRLQAFLMPAHIEHSVSETVSFVNELVADTDLCVRSSGTDAFPMSRLVGAQAKITHDTGSSRGSVAASRAKLTIHNYLGTSWLETLAMDIPTVCFYDPTMYRPRAAAQPFIDALVRVGVVHYSGREAAKFVNSLRGDPSSWWRSTEVQEAREAFVARYANFSDNWLDAWQAEFESLLAE
jgi:putative transferase (TIGR04331 family)